MGRTVGDNSFPIWKEQEFDTWANLKGVKILLNEEIKNVNVKTLLKSAQGQKNQRIALLKEIRSCEPLEYWKENEFKVPEKSARTKKRFIKSNSNTRKFKSKMER